MSEPTATAAPPGPGAKPPGKKYAGLSRNQWIGVGVVFAVVVGVIIWRRHEANAAASSSTTAGTSSSSDECTDANGNNVPCDDSDLSGELSALQTEIETLMAQEGQSGAAGGGTTGTTSSGTTSSGTTSSPTSSATSSPATSSSTTSTGTKTAAKTTTAAAKTLSPPSGVKATKTTTTAITLTWDKVSGATSYRIRVTYQNNLVKQQTVTGTSATVSGLTADHTYGFHLASINAAGTGSENDTDIKTAKS